jgi:hypothetical protein
MSGEIVALNEMNSNWFKNNLLELHSCNTELFYRTVGLMFRK